MGKALKPSHQPPPLSILKGCYAYSHSIFWRADPPYNKAIPQLASLYESPSSPGAFSQVRGYALASFAGYIFFDGTGNLTGEGMSNRGGVDFNAISFKGSYTVAVNSSAAGPVYTGTFLTDSMGTFIDHYYVMADNWKELKFIMLNSYDKAGPLRQPVTSGILTKIH